MLQIVDYDPTWPAAHAREAERIARAIGDMVLRIHHIGSTAIPGIKAKPIIDILLEVTSLAALDEKSVVFETLGYEVMGEFGITGRRYFRRDDAQGVRTHQIHAFVEGVPHVTRHLAFRDYMRAHPAAARDYGALKARLAQAHPDDSAAYMDGKDAFVQEYERRALRWAADRAGAPAAEDNA